uniref:Uncharacterized protein n=1 Tax=viral metagenome TaxID=1070528 RepID=A0A6H1ZX51_9ZZZZ
MEKKTVKKTSTKVDKPPIKNLVTLYLSNRLADKSILVDITISHIVSVEEYDIRTLVGNPDYTDHRAYKEPDKTTIIQVNMTNNLYYFHGSKELFLKILRGDYDGTNENN